MRCAVVLAIMAVMAALALNAAGADLSAGDFLRLAAQRSALNDSYAVLRGQISHLRKNAGGAEYYPIVFEVLFRPAEMRGRLALDGKETYDIRRVVGAPNISAAAATRDQQSLLNRLGMEISDLAMGFLDYPVRGEEPPERIKTVDCRVLLLDAPDGGTVKTWISREYLFPVRAEFYAPGHYLKDKPERTLEVTGFKKIDRYYVVTDFAILGREWRTRIAFDDCKVGKNNTPEADNLFRLLNGANPVESTHAER